ncbi:hypothetical protein DL93DRAFT_2091242 [Clavulina sp. PMI_390]|nr:hypothetical protein DL93DRAFT_2091242 [Clavulina sp. PMI_390]
MYGVTHNDGASFTFTVDGTHTQDCTCYADSTVWVFRGLVCSISGLDGSTSHNLVVKHNDNNGLWLNLDFFYITTSTSTSTTSKTTSTTPPSTPTSTNPDSTTKTSTLSTSTTSTSTSTSASASMNSAEGSLSLASVSSESLASTSTAGASNSSPAHASTHSSHTGAIAGGVVGGIGGLMIVSAAVFLFLRQRGRRRGEDPALYGPTSGLYAPSTYPATDGTQSLYPLSAAVTGTPSHPSQASNSPRYGGYSGYSEPHSAIPEMSEVDAHYGNPYNAGQAAAFPVYTRVDHLAES